MKNNKKLSLTETLTIRLEEIKKIVIDSGVQEGQFQYAIKQINKSDDSYHQELFAWLEEFYSNEYKTVKNTLAQHPILWERYKELGVTNLPEQILLRQRQKALRIKWHSRPRPPKKERKKHATSNDMLDLPASLNE